MHRASYPPPHSVPQNTPRVPSTKWGDQAQQAIGERLEAATTGRPRQYHNGNAVLERADSEAAEGLGAGSPGRVLVLMGMMGSKQVSAHVGDMKGDGALRPWIQL